MPWEVASVAASCEASKARVEISPRAMEHPWVIGRIQSRQEAATGISGDVKAIRKTRKSP